LEADLPQDLPPDVPRIGATEEKVITSFVFLVAELVSRVCLQPVPKPPFRSPQPAKNCQPEEELHLRWSPGLPDELDSRDGCRTEMEGAVRLASRVLTVGRPPPNERIYNGRPCADALKTFPKYVILLQIRLSPRSGDVPNPALVGKCLDHCARIPGPGPHELERVWCEARDGISLRPAVQPETDRGAVAKHGADGKLGR
jgi:hypothetical protein